MDWCDYFIHLLINQTANLLLSTSLLKQMILQIIRGIQKPNTEKFLSRWRALLKTLKVALFVMLIYGWMMFLVKRVVAFCGGIGHLKLSLIKWRIFWFWNLVAMDILLSFTGLEKNLNSSLSFGQVTLTFCLPQGPWPFVACLKTHAHQVLNMFNV